MRLMSIPTLMITRNLTGFVQLLEKLDRICLMTIQQDRVLSSLFHQRQLSNNAVS